MKKILATFIILMTIFILPAAVISATGADMIPNDKNGIPDKVLYQEILSQLKSDNIIEKSRKEFSKQEAEKLENLYLVDYKKKVKDFKGIGYLKNLKYLQISCGITRIKGMEPLPKLKKLDISGNRLKKITFIKNFKNLKSFSAMDNQIKSLKGIGKLKKLTYIDIRYNRVQSLKELKNCEKMDRLYADYNEIKNLNGIEKMKDLKIFEVDGNNLKNLAGVQHLGSLKTLSASFNKLTDIQGVESLSKLRKLYVGINHLTDLDVVTGLKELRIIDAGRNLLKSLPDLRAARLTSYCFAYNFLTEQEFMAKLPNGILNQEEGIPRGSGKAWLQDNIQLQNLDYSIELTEPSSVKQITKNTTHIAGHVNVKGAIVRLLYHDNYQDGWIGEFYAKADENGYFEFRDLDLKSQGGRLASLSLGMNTENTKDTEDDAYYAEYLRFRIKSK